MKAIPLLVVAVLGLMLAGCGQGTEPTPVQAQGDVTTSQSTIAGPGRVEPVSEEIRVGAAMGGRIASVAVEEGDPVAKGQAVAVLENADYRARVSIAEAQLARQHAQLQRLTNGARDQERREAWAEVEATEAKLRTAREEMERRQALSRQGLFAREDLDRAIRDFEIARAAHESAAQRYSNINANARDDELQRAEAEVQMARGQLTEAQALLEKTIVRSPIDGTVLKKHKKTGESVSDAFDNPIVTVGDTSTLRVRVDVDEADIGMVKTGQRAYVTAGAYGDQKFWGTVAKIGQMLGRNTVHTDEPTERVDTKVLETLVNLDSAATLRPGLRVDAFILAGPEN